MPASGLVHSEQSRISEKGNVVPKDKNELTPQSLQNPSESDTTYGSKAEKSNKGDVGNIMETIGMAGNSPITSAAYEQNSYSEFCKEYMNDLNQRYSRCNSCRISFITGRPIGEQLPYRL